MNKFLPLMIVGVAAAATAVVTIIKRRNEREEASIVTLEDMGREVKLQPSDDVLIHGAIESLKEITSEQVRLQHNFTMTDEEQFFKVVRLLKEKGYALDDVGNLGAKISKVLDKNESLISSELKESYSLVVENNGKYVSFNLTNV